MNEELSQMAIKIALSGFGAVGILEWLKNFFKFTKTWAYALLMPVLAVGCFAAVYFLPAYVIGSILTVGVVQLNYQVIVQGFKAVVKALLNKAGVDKNDIETNNTVETEGKNHADQ